MTPPRWYSPAAVARATGLPARYMRTLLDAERIPYVQPEPNAKRLLHDGTLAALEALGIPVDRAMLDAPAESATPPKSARFARSTRETDNEP